MNLTIERLVAEIAATAADWREPDYEPRAQAVEKVLASDARFTEEGVAFAINQRMSALMAGDMRSWQTGTGGGRRVGVVLAGRSPVEGLVDVLRVLAGGQACSVRATEVGGALVGSFVDNLCLRCSELPLDWHHSTLPSQINALVLPRLPDDSGTFTPDQTDTAATEVPLFTRRAYLSVAVVDGEETEDDMERLAEDALLHDGRAPESVRIVFAPKDLEPDRYLEAFSAFRAVFPAHESVQGALKMQRAFLNATRVPHAFGEDLSYLVSRGEAEVLSPAHVRWTTYGGAREVEEWIHDHAGHLYAVVQREGSALIGGVRSRLLPMGTVHRPDLDSADSGNELTDWLRALPEQYQSREAK